MFTVAGDAKRISPCTMCTCTKEGPVCQSLKIENCFHLAQAFSQQDILKDHVCKVSSNSIIERLSQRTVSVIEKISHRTVRIRFIQCCGWASLLCGSGCGSGVDLSPWRGSGSGSGCGSGFWFLFDADPDPCFRIKALTLEKCSNRLKFHTLRLVICKSMRIRIRFQIQFITLMRMRIPDFYLMRMRIRIPNTGFITNIPYVYHTSLFCHLESTQLNSDCGRSSEKKFCFVYC